jgi:glycerophosphoryl diester phosphodiesterase
LGQEKKQMAKHRTSLLGHRGSPRQARENTLESFRLALEAGLDGLELDLHRTRDGVIAIYHDFELNGIAINQTDWPELKKLAPWMPRVEEVLELNEQFPHTRLNLEVKSQYEEPDGREAIIAKIVANWPHHERCWLSSFDPLSLIRMHKHKLKVPQALLYHLPETLELLPSIPVQGVHPHYSLLNAEQMAEFKTKGLFVYTWTVNNLEVAKQLLEWGVDGLIGDDPALLKSVRGDG